MHRLLNVINAPWAIQPDKLAQIQAAYQLRAAGGHADLAAIEARLGKPLKNEAQGYQLVRGVAIVPLHGVITKRANLFHDISGGASCELVGRDLRAALADPEVKAIILHVDSPGGTVDGTQQLTNLVAEAAKLKPLATLADGTMASAAYWIGSAAGPGSVFIADTTTNVGSIGVVGAHTDISKAEEAAGRKTKEIYSGRYKRIASSYAPLSEEGEAYLQAQTDYLYELFVDAVAEARGADVETVLANMAEGREFFGQQAIDAGLVDGIATLDQLIDRLAQPPRAPGAHTKPKGTSMTKDELLAAHPALAEALRAEGHATGLAEGASAERERILGIQAHSMAGVEKLVADMAADGKTTPDQAAARILGAQREALAKQAASLHTDAPAPVPPSTEAASDKPKAADLAAEAKKLVAEAEARGERLSFAAALTKLTKGA